MIMHESTMFNEEFLNTWNTVMKELLSNTVIHEKYSKTINNGTDKESYEELIERNQQMHIKRFPSLKEQIKTAYTEFVLTKRVLPSMRSLQFAGKGIEKRHSRIYNCAYSPVRDIYFFSETLFNLLCGTGVGFSVRKTDIDLLPAVQNNPLKKEEKGTLRYVVQDSIEGWADAILMLMRSYFDKDYDYNIEFVYDEIREKGSKISTGGLAPGYVPLKTAIEKIKQVLDKKKQYSRLSSLEVYDIVCHMSDCVLSGGIRRSALIALFSEGDNEMMSSKLGDWHVSNPQRARSNNSVVLNRETITQSKIEEILQYSKLYYGEPGFFLTNSPSMGTNPCAEIALYPYQFCNLTTVNFSKVSSQKELEDCLNIATFIGTLQASYTNFSYLMPRWRRMTEKESLLGVSLTGLARTDLFQFDFKSAARKVVEENEKVARLIGISPAARIGCVKPEGTSSLVLGTSSGIHPYHANTYIRRVRVEKESMIASAFKSFFPMLVEDDLFSSSLVCLKFPIKSPSNALARQQERIEDILERIEFMFDNWIKPTHRSGENYHNVSATVSVKESEWGELSKKIFDLKDKISGITFLNYDGGRYVQAPFEEISESQYYSLMQEVFEKTPEELRNNINGNLLRTILSMTKTLQDNPRTLKEKYVNEIEGACVGGRCEL